MVAVEAQCTSALRTWPMKASVASPVYISYVKDILDFSAKASRTRKSSTPRTLIGHSVVYSSHRLV